MGSKYGDDGARAGVGKSVKQEGVDKSPERQFEEEEETLKDERLQANFNSSPAEPPLYN